MSYPLDAYLHLTDADARAQLRALQGRSLPAAGTRQVTFIPVETLLCFGASFRVNGHGYAGANIAKAPAPIPQLAALLRRSAGSVIRKMSNLDGLSPNGAKNDALVALELTRDVPAYLQLYQRIMHTAREVGISENGLPDFLDLMPHGEPAGLDAFFEVDTVPDWQMEQAVQVELPSWHEQHPDLPEGETERLAVASQRIGQQRFAHDVLKNFSNCCAFCGLDASLLRNGAAQAGMHRMLIASHIKPWSAANGRERTDVRNGIAACPTHDAVFDQGLITVGDNLSIERSSLLQQAIDADARYSHNFGASGMLDRMMIPDEARRPGSEYLRWHRERLFTGV